MNSHNLSKAKANSNTVNNLKFRIWDSLTIFWALPKGSGHFSGPISAAHIACILGSGYLHSTTAVVLGGHPMVLASQKCCDLSFNWAALSPTASRKAPFMVPSLNFSEWPHQLTLKLYLHQCPLSWPLTVPSLSCSPWPLHVFKTSTTWMTLMLPSSDASSWYSHDHFWTRLLCTDPEETLPTLMMLVSS